MWSLGWELRGLGAGGLTRDSFSRYMKTWRYKLSLEFPSGYPYNAPTVKFLTPCYHPNVDTQGNICLDILKDKWSALYDVRTILLSIQSLPTARPGPSPRTWGPVRTPRAASYPHLTLLFLHPQSPTSYSPLNTHAAELWKTPQVGPSS